MNEHTDKEDPVLNIHLPHHHHTAMVGNPSHHTNNCLVVDLVHYTVDLPKIRAKDMGLHIHKTDHIQLGMMQNNPGTDRLQCVFSYLLDILI